MNNRLFLQLKSAVQQDRSDLIRSLTKDHTPEELKNTLMIKDDTHGESILHLTALGSSDGSKICCYDSAVEIKNLFSPYLSEWLQLLKHQTTRGLDTVIHRAARDGMTDLIRLLSDGLTSEAWLSVLLLKNKSKYTAARVIFNRIHNGELSEIIECVNTFLNPLALNHKKIFLSEIKNDLKYLEMRTIEDLPIQKFMKSEDAKKIAIFSIWAKENAVPKEIIQDVTKKMILS